MKKIIALLLLTSFFYASTHAQIQKNSILFGVSGNFSFKNSGGDDMPKLTGSGNEITAIKERTLTTSFNIGYGLSSKDIVGIAVSYNQMTTETRKNQYFHYNVIIDPTTVYEEARLSSRQHSFKYGLYYRRFIRLAKRFYFSPMFLAQLEQTEATTTNDRTQTFENTGQISTLITETKHQTRHSNIGIHGFFNYQVCDWLHLQARLLSADVRVKSYDSNISLSQQTTKTAITVDVNPVSWQFGALFIINWTKK